MSQDVDRPRLVVGHDLVLPNEQAARQTADRLAQRGHRWVLLEACTQPPSQDPRLAGWWQVWSLDEGPPYYTTTDLGWHQIAAEERALCTLARSLGGFYDTRTLVGGAEVGQELTLGIDSRLQPVHELDGPHTRARRAATVPADVHDPSPPPAGPPLPGASMTPPAADPVELVGLDQVPWASLQASDIPWLLAELTEMHEAAYVGLLNELMPQGTCYPWTTPAIPFLGQLATSPAVPAICDCGCCMPYSLRPWPA